MAVSANTLFHFTKAKGLEGILTSMGFYCQYSDEHFENILPSSVSDHRFVYTPMISFCDLTIMQLSNDSSHRKYFGNYGIGLKKSWGTKNGISPVMYVHRASQAAKQFPELIKVTGSIENLLLKKGVDYITTSKMKDELIDSLKYIKPYKGIWHKGREKERYYLLQRREWRYCPKLTEHPILSGKIKENKTEKENINEDLKKHLIKFQPKDVKFILLQTKKEISKFTKTIQGFSGLSDNDRNDLVRKLRTFEEIKEDY